MSPELDAIAIRYKSRKQRDSSPTTRNENLTLLLRRSNFYISIHSQCLRSTSEIFSDELARERENKQAERAKTER